MKKMKIILIMALILGVFIPSVNAYGWGFKKNDNHTIPEIGIYKEEIAGTDSYFIGNKSKVYLTFDAGYDNGNIKKIVDILSELDVPATIFCTGDFIVRSPELIKYIDDNNVLVGNHMYSHKEINKISHDELVREINKTEEVYKQITNKEMVKLFRPPKGEFDRKSLMNIKALGYKTFFWSIAYVDWNTKDQKGVDYTYNSVVDNIHDGAIILMHTVSDDNVLALPKIIEMIRSMGYEFDSIENI